MIRKLDLKIFTDKSEYLLGEPVIAYVQLINSGTEAVTIVDQIDPKYEHVNFYIKKENKEVLFIPYSVVDSDLHTSILEPAKSITEAIKIFYGGNGWTFEFAGKYQIRSSYNGTIGKVVDKIDSNVTYNKHYCAYKRGRKRTGKPNNGKRTRKIPAV